MEQLLLVEGKNDLHVFYNIFEKHSVKQSFKPEGKDGDSKNSYLVGMARNSRNSDGLGN